MKEIKIKILYFDTIICDVTEKFIYAETVEDAIELLKEEKHDNVIILSASYCEYELANFILTSFIHKPKA